MTQDAERVRVELLWPNPKATVAHVYVKGAGTLDAALCGQILGPAWEPSIHYRDPICERCRTLLNDGTAVEDES